MKQSLRLARSAISGTLIFLTSVLFSTSLLAGSWQNNVNIGGFNKVHIYTPDSTSTIGNGKGLLLVLHGCTQSIDAYLTANLEDAAEQYGLVIAVPDAMNKAGFSCWSYWQGTKSRSAGDYKNLITLANTLSGDSSRNIDPDQVYIAGLSSGAAFANTTACLAPDVFAGMGISAGPSIGTSSNGAIGPCESADVAARCSQYGGSYGSHFDTQIASIAQGENDTTVNLCYNQQNADGMAALYGVSQLPGTNTLSEGPSNTARETQWQDGRVTMLWFDNLDHSWSGGQGASGSYVNGNSINYASYLGQYFLENNQRVDRNAGPVLENVQFSVNGSQIIISGSATDAEGSVLDVSANISGPVSETLSGNVDAGDQFTLVSASLPDGLYTVIVVATDNESKSGEPITGQVRVGPEPPATAPVLADIAVAAQGQCATVTGKVTDENLNLDTVEVTFATGTVVAEVNVPDFSAEACNLPGGSNTAQVTATDLTNLSSSQNVSFDIDAGQTATLDGHISAGRLDYTNYANCYLEYSTAPFKLNEIPVGQQCQWQDGDASCTGPLQACSGSGGGSGGGNGGGNGGGSGSQCSEVTTANYYHKVAGRAYSTGNIYVPDYFANGSDDAMPGSTWGNNTLHSDDDTTWYLGTCP